MKYRRSDFLASRDSAIEVDEILDGLDETLFAGTPVLSVSECDVRGTLHFDGKNRVVSSLEIDGIMLVPDSITGQSVESEFYADSETVYSFEPTDEEDVVVVLQDTIDLTPEIIQAIAYEAPMSITRLKREDYPSGNGWSLVSDKDAPKPKEEDPRWAKLKDFQIEDD